MSLVLDNLAFELSGSVALMRLLPRVLDSLRLLLKFVDRLLVLDLIKVFGLLAEVVRQHVVALEFVGQAFLLVPHVLIHYALVRLLVLYKM